MDTTTELSPELIEEFVIACHGDFPKIRDMLEQEPGLLNEKWVKVDENGLEASGHMGRADIANHLLGLGAPLTVFAAAMLGRTEDVATFIHEDPERAKAPGVHGISILYHAALSGKVEIAEMLAEHSSEEAGHALHAAVEPGHAEMVEWLLAHGADPNVPDWRGKTPLDTALSKGHTSIAEMMKAHGGVEAPAQEEQGA